MKLKRLKKIISYVHIGMEKYENKTPDEIMEMWLNKTVKENLKFYIEHKEFLNSQLEHLEYSTRNKQAGKRIYDAKIKKNNYEIEKYKHLCKINKKIKRKDEHNYFDDYIYNLLEEYDMYECKKCHKQIKKKQKYAHNKSDYHNNYEE